MRIGKPGTQRLSTQRTSVALWYSYCQGVPTDGTVDVLTRYHHAPPVQIDEKTRVWQKENPWFNTDEEMTSFALGLHNRLVKEGVDPQTDDYYERINTRMREVFPENFEDEPEVRQQQRSNNVVAPATRSTAPKKIRLTQTQLTLAKRLGLTPEQYAKQVALDMRKNNG